VSVLIDSARAPLKVHLLRCITHDERYEWALPRDHKDHEENVIQATARETYEESGYPCQLLPLNVTTLAPAVAGQQMPAPSALVPKYEEPFMLTLRCYKDTSIKLISCFVTVRTGADKANGTQMAARARRGTRARYLPDRSSSYRYHGGHRARSGDSP